MNRAEVSKAQYTLWDGAQTSLGRDFVGGLVIFICFALLPDIPIQTLCRLRDAGY